ncbi:hypothetical protein Pcac1_g10403 [Phytophthora cactorum]|nr:hypothetical protein Pcac1_g10403 [Phytophthora cactorum]
MVPESASEPNAPDLVHVVRETDWQSVMQARRGVGVAWRGSRTACVAACKRSPHCKHAERHENQQQEEQKMFPHRDSNPGLLGESQLS